MLPPDIRRSDRAIIRRATLWTALAGLWLFVVVGGLVVVARYDNAAGADASEHRQWPAGSGLVRDRRLPTLIMVAHPRCSCTVASLTELAEIMARADGRLRAYVVFAKPDRLEGDSRSTELWKQASRIPQVSLVTDNDGRVAAAFGAATSGQVFVYSPAGELLFSGGTTRSRGHAGDNAGRRTILALLSPQPAKQRTTPVFGCALFGPADQPNAPAGNNHEHDAR